MVKIHYWRNRDRIFRYQIARAARLQARDVPNRFQVITESFLSCLHLMGWLFTYLLMWWIAVFGTFHLKCPLGKLHLKNSSKHSKLSQIISCCPSQSQLKSLVIFPCTWVLGEAALCDSVVIEFSWLNKCPMSSIRFPGYLKKNKTTDRAMTQWLKAQNTLFLQNIWVWVLATHMVAYNHWHLQFQGMLCSLLDRGHQARISMATWYTDVHSGKLLIYRKYN